MLKSLEFIGFPLHYVCTEGNIYTSQKRGSDKIWEPMKMVLKEGKDGYLFTCITYKGKSKNIKAHRYVAECFIYKMEGKTQVNHKDGNKKNNNIDNLEWCTPSENMYHAYRTGLASKFGEKNSMSKLTEEDVRKIREMILQGLTNKQIAKFFGVANNTISGVKTGAIWSWLR